MKTKNTKSTKATVSSKQIASALTAFEKVTAPFAGVPALTPTDRKRMVKIRRGAHQVIPTIAILAQKFAIEAPGLQVDDMLSNLQQATDLEPLLNAVAAFHQTLKDAHLAASGAAWKTAMVTYVMLRSAGEANRRVGDELVPVQQWFRHRVSSSNAASATGTAATPASAPAAIAPAAAATGKAPPPSPQG